MPELPEVEILVRHLAPLLKNKTIRRVVVHRPKVLQPTTERRFREKLSGAKFLNVSRRGKYLVFTLRPKEGQKTRLLLGHLGMTGRMYLQPARLRAPKHAAVVLELGKWNFIYEDTRYFGRLTLDGRALELLGPEPFAPTFTTEYLAAALKRSAQPIKVRLLDQSLVAGVGNIYASEALFRAGLSPRVPARRLCKDGVERLRQALQEVMVEAIEFGSTVPLNWSGRGERDALFYYGRVPRTPDSYVESLRVYDRLGEPCRQCETPIKRIVQAARSTFYCPRCQS